MQVGGLKLLLSEHEGDKAIVQEMWGMNVYRYHPEPMDIVIDIGAHRGIFATWAAAHGAHVFAYEPCRDSYEALCINTEQNHFQHLISSRNMAVWSQSCRMQLYHWPADAGGHSLMETTRSVAEEVLCTTLHEIFTHIRWCDFLKVDCEGSEFEILGTAPSYVLQKIGRMAVEVHSPAMDPGGREHPMKFTAYTEQKFQRILDVLEPHFNVEILRARNGDPNYLYCVKK